MWGVVGAMKTLQCGCKSRQVSNFGFGEQSMF